MSFYVSVDSAIIPLSKVRQPLRKSVGIRRNPCSKVGRRWLKDNCTGFLLAKRKPIAEPGRHGDGGGLYLRTEAGAHRRRQWIFLSVRAAPASAKSLALVRPREK